MKTLRQSITDYLAMRRSLGYKLQKAGRELPDFAAFMERRRATYITQELALTWARTPQHMIKSGWASRLCQVRQFAHYRSAIDPRTQIPAFALLPYKPSRAKPHLYSDSEITQLLRAALHMPIPRGGFDHGDRALLPWVYYCFFGLLAVTGLRVGEARNLMVEDVDLKAGVLTIRGSKFGKDRLVPLHPSTCKVLAEYLRIRERQWAGRPVSRYVFISCRGNRLGRSQIREKFCAVSRQIGLRGPHDTHGPRLHDLRHRFATTTLVNWYRSKEDPQQRLPILSAFLGHVHVADTQWYLSASPELMREAMRRLEHRWAKQS
jgi:integrase/recombinase XerD